MKQGIGSVQELLETIQQIILKRTHMKCHLEKLRNFHLVLILIEGYSVMTATF